MKNAVLATVFLLTAAALFSFTEDDIQHFTLENGMKVFVLSDTTAAPVRFELAVNAGYASQSEKTAGFFPLYARLLGADISADRVRIVKIVAPQESEKTMADLSRALKPLNLPDNLLRAELNAMKTEVSEYAASTAGFINTAIDARMFAAAPWKVESGVYPALFSATTISSARALLNDIALTWYTPQNATLYISGNITVQAAVALAEQYFGAPTAKTPALQATPPASPAPAKKFVLVDEDFSEELVQLVMQYDTLSTDEADTLAAVLNNDYGTYKQTLLAQNTLGILGAEYINVASAQRHGSSRLIIQTLLGRNKTSPCTQAETFLQTTQTTTLFSEAEMQYALTRITSAFKQRSDDSAALMELLSAWDALTGASSVTSLFTRHKTLPTLFAAPILEATLQVQKPVVFVLTDTKTYATYAKEFQRAGYEAVTRKNGSWYTQELYKERFAQKQQSIRTPDEQTDIQESAKRFIAQNKKDFSTRTLANGIPVTLKKTTQAKTAAIALTIDGGELLFAETAPGLCAVLTDALSVNIRRSLDERTMNGILTGDTDVHANTYAACSVITVTCAADETERCLEAIADALIYGDITPAMADGITYDERTQWRIKSGAAPFQLLCSAMRTLYEKHAYVNLFDDTKDRPRDSDFTAIAAAYPLMLDSSRFSLIVTGGIRDTERLCAALEQTFGALISQKATESIGQTVPVPKMPRRIKRIQMRHLFLTDISADKAGPRPAVLVPTKNFYDPTLYCIPCPDLASTDIALFNALLYEIAERMQTKLGTDITMRTDVSDADIPFARLYAQNVTHIAKIDTAYQEVIAELTDDFQTLITAEQNGVADLEKDPLLSAIENRWLMLTLSATGTVIGTVQLIQQGTRYHTPTLYLDQYAAVDAATAADYFILMRFYFSDLPDFRVYSIDSKR